MPQFKELGTFVMKLKDNMITKLVVEALIEGFVTMHFHSYFNRSM